MLSDVYKCFMPECFLDTNLVEVLLEKPNSVNHRKGNSSVAVLMDNGKYRDSFVVGIIDDDKVRLKELDNFDFIERLSRNGIKLYSHPLQKHYFILISPAIEKWIINECEKGALQISDYDLPDTLNILKKMKGITQRSDIRFKRLFKDMLKIESCDEITELKRWLTFFKDNNTNSNIELL